MSSPQLLRILVSAAAAPQLAPQIGAVLAGRAHLLVTDEDAATDADLAFVSRDITGRSTKHEILPATQRFYDALRSAASLRWVHIHSAGADRAIFGELRARGVEVTTSSGANADVVAQTAVAGVLALARHFPQYMAAQRERRWAPPTGGVLPRDLRGQRALIVGWGPVGQEIARLLQALGLHCTAVRRQADATAAVPAIAYEDLAQALPRTDWLVLACPLSARTRGLVDAAALAALAPGARLVNVARGEVVVEADLVAALQEGSLAGAFLDVFAHEPLPAASPLWMLDNVIVTPHAAGHSDANAQRVAAMFLDNLARWRDCVPLANRIP
ncbi:D-2-hydroxyacid dehydrogenase [uncultured Ramlibacter sp.]|uniref:D-2-hydroxyacid dehydrogenase n=1 Tax=uncultured Ramlibacter sp. TaxID=260755 RepID=UPI0026080A7F|nr:D-2-hydroxyacid dehydrogenase [uncultured Ramlibacter sp.]